MRMLPPESQSQMKHLQVACAIVEHDGRILAAQRGETMAMALKWEFPGGKIMVDETPKECLRRELEEELAIHVDVGQFLPTVTHRYSECLVTLHPFVCRIVSGEIILHEHHAVVWFTIDDVPELDWAEADIPVLELYRQWQSSATPENEPEAGRN